MTQILDQTPVRTEYANFWTQETLALPSGKYVAVMLGPNSEHDIADVQFPGFAGRLSRGSVLPLPNAAADHPAVIKVTPVRGLSARLQVIGVEFWEEASVAMQLRPPYVYNRSRLTKAANDAFTYHPCAGRATAHIELASITGAPPNITLTTYGRTYYTTFDSLGATTNFDDVLLNTVAWPAGESCMAWDETINGFDELVVKTHNSSGVNIVLRSCVEIRD